MKVAFIACLGFLIIMLGDAGFARTTEQVPRPAESGFYAPYKIINVFLRAVNRGELIIFDQILDESMLIPLRVEYIYELDSNNQSVKVYSELMQPLPLPVPSGQTLIFHGVSAVLNAKGHIIEVEAHVWPRE
ncbi:hypothetical protein [Sulfuriflexus sp.]|uniref:hypothetical protein n=1 Tax=Sulfuriflexus sp. TaxID=2015443 RepID=UPI0028CEE91A|nr:hypothetical protein [Sulfuriflexus sp.]MDT8403578.1 hypothetical protein [Sulfuriflexus sp.]